jgi:pimeloyl-ACP methyl ester carboxylesterase
MNGMKGLAPQFIEVDGLRVRYVRSQGGGAGTPVLLLSPFPESLYAYDSVWAELSQAAPLVALDLPGFGQSQSRPDVMTSEAMGGFVAKAIEALGLGRVHAIGPDVGTSTLLFAASQRPDLFVSLVVGSGGTDVARVGAGLKDIIFAPTTEAFEKMDGGDFAVGVLARRTKTPPADFVHADYRASYANPRAVESMAYLRAYTTYLPLLQARLASIRTPVLSIWGEHDPIVLPSSREVLDAALPHTRSLVLDSDHFAWHDAPKAYAAALIAWFEGGYAAV